jgi:hypothetical protein
MNALCEYAALIRVIRGRLNWIDFGFKRETPKTVGSVRNFSVIGAY